MKKSICLTVLFIMVASIQVFAGMASRTINYQGRLTDNNNAPVADGNYVMTFRLYDDANALQPNAKWSETHTTVATKNGYFNVTLGGISKFYNSPVDFNLQYWLGIQVGSDSEMSPRQALSGVPMTLNYDVPLGSIMAWHKNMPSSGMPGLADQWVECNGQVLADTESIFNGQTIPNLNGNNDLAKQALPVDSGGTTITAIRTPVFLRGGTTSGVGQMDTFQGHVHSFSAVQNAVGDNLAAGTTFNALVKSQNTSAAVDDGTNSTPRTSAETRPVNMSVVWIMKIK